MRAEERVLLAPFLISAATLLATLAVAVSGLPRVALVVCALIGLILSLILVFLRRKDVFRSWQDVNQYRTRRYQQNRGLFIVHTSSSPSKSTVPGQKADVTLWLEEHGTSLTLDKVDHVEYVFGEKFSAPARVTNLRANNFETTDSLYSPLLVVAIVTFKNEEFQPLLLERYVNFAG